MRRAGIFLILTEIMTAAGLLAALLISADVRRMVDPLYCDSDEILVSRSGNSLFECEGDDRQFRTVTGTVVLSILGLSALPFFLGIFLLVQKPDSGQRHQVVITNDGRAYFFSSDDPIIHHQSRVIRLPGVEIRFDESDDNMHSILELALLQLEQARNAGLVSEEDFERARVKIQAINRKDFNDGS